MINKRYIILAALMILVLQSACGSKEESMAAHFEKGKSFLEKGDYDKARIEFQNVLQIQPTYYDAQYYYARVLEAKGNIREAVGHYRNVVDSDPAHLESRLHLARIYLLGGAPDLALAVAQQALKLAPDNTIALTVVAGVHAEKNEIEDAIALGKKIIRIAPGNIDARMLLASLYTAQSKSADAIAVLEDGLNNDPTQASLRSAITRVYIDSGQEEKAVASMQKIVDEMPNNLHYHAQLAAYYATMKKIDDGEKVMREGVSKNPENSEFKLALAEYLVNYRDKESAISQLVTYVSSDTSNLSLQLGLAKIYESTKNYDKAKALYDTLIGVADLTPDGLKARVKLATIFAGEKNDDRAKKLIAEVLKESPRDAEALTLRGTISLRSQNAADAVADFRVVLKDQPNSTALLKLLARAYILNNEVALASEALQKAIAADQTDSEARLAYADLLIRSNNAERAIAQLSSAAKISPNNLQVLEALMRAQLNTKDYSGAANTVAIVKEHFEKRAVGYYFAGLLNGHQGKTDLAIKEFNQAILLEPGAAEPLTALVKLYLNNRQAAKAMIKVLAVIKAEPNHFVALNLKGELLLTQNKIQDAQQAFRKAIALNPAFVTPYRNLASSYLSIGDEAAAVQVYKQGLEPSDYNSVLVVSLANYYEQKNKIEEAITLYQTAMKTDASKEIYANNLAMLLASYKHDSKNIALAHSLTERFKQTKNPAYMDTVGWVYYREGNYANAVSLLEKALQTIPDQPMLQYHLGMAQYGIGDSVTAKHNLELAVKSDMRYPGKEEAKATLEKLAGL